MFDLFPIWLIGVVVVVEVLISFFFVFAWFFMIHLTLEARRDGKVLRKEITRMTKWMTADPEKDPKAEAVNEAISERLEQRRRDRQKKKEESHVS